MFRHLPPAASRQTGHNLHNDDGHRRYSFLVTRPQLPGSQIPCPPLESQPGDVLFADMNTCSFVPEPRTQEDIDMLKENHQGELVRWVELGLQ